MTNPIDISALDDDANRMKAAWKKTMNYAASFARDFRKQAETFSPGKYAPDQYGAEWTFSRWMLLKVGPSETTALRFLQLLDKRAAIEDKRGYYERLAEIKREKQAAKKRKTAARAEIEPKPPQSQPKLQLALPKPTNGGDPLAARGHAARSKIKRGSDLWIEGVMELAMVMAEARDQYPATQDFGDWLTSNKLDCGKNNRAALIGMGRLDSETLRNLLKTSHGRSIQLIWRVFQNARVPNARNSADDKVVTA